MSKPLDLTGKRFGRLVAVELSKRTSDGYYWRCQCDCGNEIEVYASSLHKGLTKSCGCLIKDVLSERNKKNAKHGMSRSRLYRTYYGMKHRCYDPKDSHYKNYGAKGITICNEWLESFKAFQDWALANGYTDELTIDRIDNSKGYSPSNCRWATKAQQVRNSSATKYYTYKGKTLCIADWAKEKGISKASLYQRLERGIPFEIAIEQPYKRRKGEKTNDTQGK